MNTNSSVHQLEPKMAAIAQPGIHSVVQVLGLIIKVLASSLEAAC